MTTTPVFVWTVSCDTCGWQCANVVKSAAEAQAKWHRPRCELKTQRVLDEPA